MNSLDVTVPKTPKNFSLNSNKKSRNLWISSKTPHFNRLTFWSCECQHTKIWLFVEPLSKICWFYGFHKLQVTVYVPVDCMNNRLYFDVEKFVWLVHAECASVHRPFRNGTQRTRTCSQYYPPSLTRIGFQVAFGPLMGQIISKNHEHANDFITLFC